MNRIENFKIKFNGSDTNKGHDIHVVYDTDEKQYFKFSDVQRVLGFGSGNGGVFKLNRSVHFNTRTGSRHTVSRFIDIKDFNDLMDYVGFKHSDKNHHFKTELFENGINARETIWDYKNKNLLLVEGKPLYNSYCYLFNKTCQSNDIRNMLEILTHNFYSYYITDFNYLKSLNRNFGISIDGVEESAVIEHIENQTDEWCKVKNVCRKFAYYKKITMKDVFRRLDRLFEKKTGINISQERRSKNCTTHQLFEKLDALEELYQIAVDNFKED